MKSFYRWVAIASVLLVGAGVSIAARNSSGTYSLPSGNPVVSGSTITSSWANNTLTDISTEITSSLDRYGRGAMLAPLKATSGTETAPSLTFSSETTSGLYRAGAGDVRLTLSGTDAVQWDSSGETLTGNMTASGELAASGLTATQSTTDADAITARGNGTGSGLVAYSGDGGTNVAAVEATAGAANGHGIRGTGAGTGYGVIGSGGSDGTGGSFSGYGSGDGVSGLALGTGYGGSFRGSPNKAGILASAGTSATSTTRHDAIEVANGDINLDGVTEPSSTTSIKNRLTPSNIIKAWGHISCASSGCTISRGFNLTSVSVSGGSVLVVLAADVTSGAVTTSFGGGGGASTVQAAISSSGVTVGFFNGTTKIDVGSLSSNAVFDFIATGVQ